MLERRARSIRVHNQKRDSHFGLPEQMLAILPKPRHAALLRVRIRRASFTPAPLLQWRGRAVRGHPRHRTVRVRRWWHRAPKRKAGIRVGAGCGRRDHPLRVHVRVRVVRADRHVRAVVVERADWVVRAVLTEVVLRLLEVRGMQVAVHLPHVRERRAVDGVPWRKVVVLRARE